MTTFDMVTAVAIKIVKNKIKICASEHIFPVLNLTMLALPTARLLELRDQGIRGKIAVSYTEVSMQFGLN
uniref:Uncharacterized protein n=1 Tax=viral metagenome TaxID=1070528 RepID=A0A6M3IVW5_9ZZZZ